MGGFQTKEKKNVFGNEDEKVVESLKYKIRLLQGEVSDVLTMRDAEIQAYEREMVVFAFKEAEWKKERKRLREEVKKLRKKFEEREQRFLAMEKRIEGGTANANKKFSGGQSFLVEQIKEEKARRDDAVEKWKQLYFSIKVELDDLIQRANPGTGLCWNGEGEEALLEELQKELTAKEETIKRLEGQLSLMKQQEAKREREVDILRQSLRIMCYNKKVTSLEKKVTKTTMKL